MDERIFYKNGYYCSVKRNIGESYDSFVKRSYYILDNIGKYDIEKLILMSNIWINENNLGCKYKM